MSNKPSPSKSDDAVQESIELTLHEFCIRLSVEDRRVELISAFESDERRFGRLKDTAEKFAARYQAFINSPA